MKKVISIILILLSIGSLIFGGIKLKEYLDDSKNGNKSKDIENIEKRITETENKIKEKTEEIEKVKEEKKDEIKVVEEWQKKVEKMESYLS